MPTTLLSIVIPTHKRAQILQTCLERIEKQTIVNQLEVIVVSDGEDANLKRKMENDKWKMPVRYFEVPKSQQGIARNRGVKEATGNYVLFIGDDIFLSPDACARHVAILHSQFSILHSFAVLGHTTWDPALQITPVMRWLESSGWQFGYPAIRPFAHLPIPESIQHKFTYTSHISLPTDLAKKFPFREDVTLYGWEDIEWGMRLQHANVPLFYNPDARALHHHHITLEQSLKRMETLGRSAVVMDRLVPELKLVPRGWKKMKYRIASMFPGMRGAHARKFMKGLHSPPELPYYQSNVHVAPLLADRDRS